MEERDGPASSAGGVGSRLRPYVFRITFGGSGTSIASDFSGYDEGKAVSDDVDMMVGFDRVDALRFAGCPCF